MIKINGIIEINEKKINYRAIRSTGPGGQHVNKVSTAILLEYSLREGDYPTWFIKKIKENIINNQITKDGLIKIKAKSFKSQSQNKKDALNRLIDIFKKSATRPKKRKKKSLSKISIEKRLMEKKMKSNKKKLRKSPKLND